MPIREVTLDDFETIDMPKLSASSYKNVAFPLGCSRTELESVLGEGEYALLDDTSKVVGLARIKALFSGIGYIDLYLLESGVESIVDQLLIQLGGEYGIGKYYIQVLESEKKEQTCLENIGFTAEVKLREHLYINGRYQDLVMMGSKDCRPD